PANTAARTQPREWKRAPAGQDRFVCAARRQVLARRHECRGVLYSEQCQCRGSESRAADFLRVIVFSWLIREGFVTTLVAALQFHSARSAMTGSIPTARRAGSQTPTNATAARTSGTTVNTAGSRG